MINLTLLLFNGVLIAYGVSEFLSLTSLRASPFNACGEQASTKYTIFQSFSTI